MTTAERTPKDYAIEFGEYLAKTAEGYIEAINTGGQFRADHFHSLKSAIYEFRKRAERAIQSDAASAPSVPDGWQLVPINMTSEMESAGLQALDCGDDLDDVYSVMLSAAPKQQDGWRPIETAPKDGFILATHINHSFISLVSWSEYAQKWSTPSDCEANEYYDKNFFTHWMPLPPAPKKED